jgi:hypothetical protein
MSFAVDVERGGLRIVAETNGAVLVSDARERDSLAYVEILAEKAWVIVPMSAHQPVQFANSGGGELRRYSSDTKGQLDRHGLGLPGYSGLASLRWSAKNRASARPWRQV